MMNIVLIQFYLNFFVYQKLASCVEFKGTVLCGGGSKNGNDNNNNT